LFYAVGAEARQAEPGGDVLIENTPVAFDNASAAPVMAGQVRLFIGVRSDPFFADADGSFHGFKWTGQDAFADRNVLSIVMEVPDDMLSADPVIGLGQPAPARRLAGPGRPGRASASCCRTSFATTGASRSGTRTGAP
jgi:hypothetical protein